jgi:hypothetical protein
MEKTIGEALGSSFGDVESVRVVKADELADTPEWRKILRGAIADQKNVPDTGDGQDGIGNSLQKTLDELSERVHESSHKIGRKTVFSAGCNLLMVVTMIGIVATNENQFIRAVSSFGAVMWGVAAWASVMSAIGITKVNVLMRKLKAGRPGKE